MPETATNTRTHEFYKSNEISESISNTWNFNDESIPLSGSIFDDGLCIGTLQSPTKRLLPAIIPLQKTKGLCFVATSEQDRHNCHETLQKLAMRIGLSLPAGQCRFTLYDGTGMGRNLMALSALNSKIKGENILTEPDELKRACKKYAVIFHM